MNIEDIISSGLLELYALGLSSAEETKQVEEWILQYPEVKNELMSIEASLEIYAAPFAKEPSHLVKDKIFASINQDKPSSVPVNNINHITDSAKVYKMPSSFKALAAAVVILLIGSIALNYIYFHKYEAANNHFQTAQNDLKNIQQKMQENAEMKNEMEVIEDKNSLPVVLNGTPHAPDAVAKIYWLKNTGDVYVDPTFLPKVPSGKQYQLWAIVDGKPVSGGLITTEGGTYHIQKMKSFGHAQAFAITLEKAGGSEKPTMDQLYVISKV